MTDLPHDLAALQGAWTQIDFEENGISNPPDETGAPGAITTFDKDQFEVRTAEGDFLLAGSFELFPMSSPKTVDWIDSTGPDAGKRLLSIYKLEADRFVFIAADEGMQRPTIFRTGPGQTMRTFLRTPDQSQGKMSFRRANNSDVAAIT